MLSVFRMSFALFILFGFSIPALATISGISTSTNNGVERITNNQHVTGAASIDGETVILDRSSSYLEASGSGEIIVTNSQIKLDSDVPGGNDTTAVINYGGRAVTTAAIRFQNNTSILAGPFSSRKNIQITELSGGSSVIEAENTGELFVYSQTDAILSQCTFRGINVWELYQPPSIAFEITVENVNYGYLNWEAGRIDFIRFGVSGASISDAWLGNGNSGNNSVYHWNNVQFDNTNIRFQSTNGEYYEGWTVSWEFQDKISEVPIEDVLVIYNDDSGGSQAELGRYTTNSSGHLVGTFESQFRVTGPSQERGALFVRTIQSDISGSDHSSGGGNTYSLTTVTPQIEIRSYEYEVPVGYEDGDDFSISSEIGDMNSDTTVNEYKPFFMPYDDAITETNQSTVNAYVTIDDLDQLYDRIKSGWRDNDGYPYSTVQGPLLIMDTAYELIVDALAAQPFAVNTSTNQITIKTSDLQCGVNKTFLWSEAGITTLNGATVSCANSTDSVVDISGDTTPPVVTITAVTKDATNDVINDTTIMVTDDTAIVATDVRTALSSQLASTPPSCTQTSATQVDCTIEIIGGGNLTIEATDAAGNTASATESGYELRCGRSMVF